jgi:hypothetical protein
MELLAQHSVSEVSRQLGVSRASLRDWRDRGIDPSGRAACPMLEGQPAEPAAYAALFGFYLGDGCISRVGRSYSLRITTDASYPRVIEEVGRLMVEVRGRGPVNRVRAPGCIVVCGYWNHWPCLFPQHGPGRKHERKLTLEPWQEQLLAEHPGPFLRGLFHSDGCRTNNWATRTVAGERKRYDYPRWQFTNNSLDIQRFCTGALDTLAIPWRQSNWKTVSVSRREGVATLDRIVGPKA